MIYNTNQISLLDKETILNLYQQHKDINYIIRNTPFNIYEILSILLKKGIPNQELIPNTPITNISSKKIIFISDTHIGSIYQNLSYLNKVYEYALNNNIDTIIHLGDLFQSTVRNVSPIYLNPTSQLNEAISFFRSFPMIKTYILFGNHDLHLLKKDDSFLEELSNLNNISILGFKRAYLSYQSIIISLHHPITKYDLTIPQLKETLSIYGHRHQLNLKDNKIFLSTLSDDIKTYSNEPGIPSFIILSLDNGIISINNITLDFKTKKLIYHKNIE